MASSRSKHRFLFTSLCLLVLVSWLGCGKGEYDSRLETRIQQLRTQASSPETTDEASQIRTPAKTMRHRPMPKTKRRTTTRHLTKTRRWTKPSRLTRAATTKQPRVTLRKPPDFIAKIPLVSIMGMREMPP